MLLPMLMGLAVCIAVDCIVVSRFGYGGLVDNNRKPASVGLHFISSRSLTISSFSSSLLLSMAWKRALRPCLSCHRRWGCTL